MLETLFVLVGVGALGGLALLVASLTPLTLVWTSAGLMGAGLLLGVPGGIMYHVVLRRELLRLDALARGWLLRPTSFHGALDELGMSRMRPWFFAGGLGFLLIMLGGSLLLVTVVTHFR